jgi:hypothetical protein
MLQSSNVALRNEMNAGKVVVCQVDRASDAPPDNNIWRYYAS